MKTKIAVAVHGGAGSIRRASMTTNEEKEYHVGLQEALKKAYSILSDGGTALDAVTYGLCVLEENELFNAGRGAVFNHFGQHEMDAALMCGKSLKAGAVCNVQRVKSPILLAKAVMENSSHVLLSSQGAENFALENGLELMPESYFFTEQRFKQWVDIRDTKNVALENTKELGTAGVVAVDDCGNLAAATSTGGMTNKRYMRIGDSPIIGAGTYANNNTCAISCTGHGEYFLRSVTAYDISCLIEYAGKSLREASEIAIMEKLTKMGGSGGIIAVNSSAELSLRYNTSGMYRGWKKSGEKYHTAIFEEVHSWEE